MLIILHLISLLVNHLIRERKRRKMIQDQNSVLDNFQEDMDASDAENTIKFDPPVYRQRYGAVYDHLIKEEWRKDIKKLVDFGSAELGLFVFIKRLISLQEIMFVDIDEELLESSKFRVRPLNIDYLKTRSGPLNIGIYAGSVAEPDEKLIGADAVTAIELIEHLYPDVIEGLVYNIFSYIQPKIVIVTTPNADFNVLFGDMKTFRHYDHKFEWTREQFENWALNVVQRFPNYSVVFSGVGEPPANFNNLGFCSQIAYFLNNNSSCAVDALKTCNCTEICPNKTDSESPLLTCLCNCRNCSPEAAFGVCTYLSHSKSIESLKLIDLIEYPYEIDDRSEEEKLLHEFRYRINMFGHENGEYYLWEKERAEIPLVRLMYGPQGNLISQSELCNLLRKAGFKLEECDQLGGAERTLCVIYEPESQEKEQEEDDDDWNSDMSEENTNSPSGYVSNDNEPANEEAESDWDEEVAQKSSTENKNAEKEDELEKKDSLFDSGYQKSAAIDDSPPNSSPLEELDTFDITSLPSPLPISNSDSRPIPLKYDVNKVNELDGLYSNNFPNQLRPTAGTFFSFTSRPIAGHSRFKAADMIRKYRGAINGAGPSCSKKRRKDRHRKLPLEKSVNESSSDDSPLEDVKLITNCFLYNTLNVLNVPEEDAEEANELIEDAAAPEDPQEEDQPALEEQQEQNVAGNVENGDLANNNRDFEGNNYINEPEVNPGIENNEINDFINENLNEVPLEQFNNNVDGAGLIVPEIVVVEPPPVQIVAEQELVDENQLIEDEPRPSNAAPVPHKRPNIPERVPNLSDINLELDSDKSEIKLNLKFGNSSPVEELDSVEEIARASREVLFDPNSEPDLDDFEEHPPVEENVQRLGEPDFDVEGGGLCITGVNLSAIPPPRLGNEYAGAQASAAADAGKNLMEATPVLLAKGRRRIRNPIFTAKETV